MSEETKQESKNVSQNVLIKMTSCDNKDNVAKEMMKVRLLK